jgi:hypothetical protein
MARTWGLGPAGKRHGIFEHGQKQGFGAVGADDLTGKSGIDQVRDPADVIDVGVGEKQKIDVCRRHREPVERHLRVMALGMPQSTRISMLRPPGSG